MIKMLCNIRIVDKLKWQLFRIWEDITHLLIVFLVIDFLVISSKCHLFVAMYMTNRTFLWWEMLIEIMRFDHNWHQKIAPREYLSFLQLQKRKKLKDSTLKFIMRTLNWIMKEQILLIIAWCLHKSWEVKSIEWLNLK